MMDVLEELLKIGAIESREHVWDNGEYQGCIVTYANLLDPDLKTIFHPYVPLMIVGAARSDDSQPDRPKVTREYFVQRGLSVPGETSSVHCWRPVMSDTLDETTEDVEIIARKLLDTGYDYPREFETSDANAVFLTVPVLSDLVFNYICNAMTVDNPEGDDEAPGIDETALALSLLSNLFHIRPSVIAMHYSTRV